MSIVNLLRVDPDLGDGLPAAARAVAERECLARAVELDGPGCSPAELMAHTPGALGLLVLTGLLIRCIAIGTSRGAEVLGPGDLLRPWEFRDRAEPPGAAWSLTLLGPVRLAVLDGAAVARLSRFPPVLSALAGRVTHRNEALLSSLAISQMPRVEHRIALVLWRLAERWGRVTPSGVRLDLPVTHEQLSWLVAARRPAVSSGVNRLVRQGTLARPAPGQWILRGEVPDVMAAPLATARPAAAA